MTLDGRKGILTKAERGTFFVRAKFILEVMCKQRGIPDPFS
jgi:hypothetical protein